MGSTAAAVNQEEDDEDLLMDDPEPQGDMEAEPLARRKQSGGWDGWWLERPFCGTPIFGQNPGKHSIFPQKDAKSGCPKIRSFEKGLADRGGWHEEILHLPEIQASFLYPFSYALLGEGGHISGELFGLFLAVRLSPTPSRQPLFETSDKNGRSNHHPSHTPVDVLLLAKSDEQVSLEMMSGNQLQRSFGRDASRMLGAMFLSVTQRGGRNKGGRKQMRANASKRRQTRTNAERKRRAQTQANATKREQKWTNANKRLHPPLFQTPPSYGFGRYGFGFFGPRIAFHATGALWGRATPFLCHFSVHLSSVLGRTELCHEVWTPGPQKPKSSAMKTTTWHCSVIAVFYTPLCNPLSFSTATRWHSKKKCHGCLGCLGLGGQILVHRIAALCVVRCVGHLALPVATSLEDRNLLK